MSGWQSIDAAPKDGTAILVYDPKIDVGSVVARWGRQASTANRIGWVEVHGDLWEMFQPTHWMPIPPAP